MKEPSVTTGRLSSLDFLRGLTMVMLTLESTRLFDNLEPLATGAVSGTILHQFTHHRWHGLHLWDLVQPVFMFVAGTAMAFSVHKQQLPWNQAFVKILKRCGWLFFWGVFDYAVRKDGLSFELWDVLTQLSFTTLVAFLVMRWSVPAQLAVSAACLLLPEILYRYTHIPSFDQPFTDQHNFGTWMDLRLMNKTNEGGWVAINCVSTTAHTIWGVLAGQLLLGSRPQKEKLKILFISGLILVCLGFGLDWLHITPIIKRIATSSFVLASGGYCFLFLAACYGWIDVGKHFRGLFFFRLFALNSIFIYLFFEIVGDRWFTGYIMQISGSLLGFIHIPALIAACIGSLLVFSLEAGILYFLYLKKIFFKL